MESIDHSLSEQTKRPWEWVVACVIAAHMAFLQLATLYGSVSRLIQGSRSFLSIFFCLLGFAMVMVAVATTRWTFARSKRSIAGYAVLTVLMAMQTVIYPQLPEATGIAFVEFASVTVGFVIYVVPLILLLRARAALHP
jgi:hypothetical protein